MSRKSSSGRPSSAARHFDEGFVLHRAGRVQEALAAYEAALALHPRHAQALHFSALLLHACGRSLDAVVRIERALALEGSADVWSNAGLIYEGAARADDALRAYQRAVAMAPDLSAAWVNIAALQLLRDEPARAEEAARRALALAASPGAVTNLAMAVGAQGRHAEVLALLGGIDSADPAVAGLRCSALKALGDLEGARKVVAEALTHANDPRLRIERARLADAAGEDAVALDDYRAVMVAAASDGDAGSMYDTALSEAADLVKRRALWHLLPPLQHAFRQRVAQHAERGSASGLAPFGFLSDDSTRAEQRVAAAAWSRRYRTMPGSMKPPATGRLKIGYLSADLHAHATGILAVGLFEQHDRTRFEIFGYSTGPDDGSALRRRLVAAFDRFVDARGWDEARLARAIAHDGIDLLVDLKGHTGEAPTAVVARRPAPIVVSYLGYPGTMGASFVDYLIGDDIVTPLAEAADYSETLVLLPGSYQVNDDRRAIAATPSRSSLNLPEDAVVLCAFNAAWKIGAGVFDAWCDILLRVPDAVLWMQPRRHGAATAARWRDALRNRGLAPERLILAPELPHAEYLALFRHADLFLDTWPYNAHTTASDALWAGCPLLTRRGDTFAGRVAESLLAAIDRRHWVAADRDDYVERGVRLAGQRVELSEMRRGLEEHVRASVLYDTAATTRAIEAAFVAMADQHRAGTRAAITVAA